jgi:hypothetical protein
MNCVLHYFILAGLGILFGFTAGRLIASAVFRRKKQKLTAAGLIILPCPHCRGAAKFQSFTNYDGHVSYKTGAVVCVKCGAQSKEEITSGYYGIAISPETIIQKWNRRCGR